MDEQVKGKVKWYSIEKGYGFIKRADSEVDIFVHHSCLLDLGKRELKEGDEVTFYVKEGKKGLQAEEVRLAK